MFFGPFNALAIFLSFIKMILAKTLYIFIIFSFDNILIYIKHLY